MNDMRYNEREYSFQLKLFYRGLVVAFWIALLAFCLYIPPWLAQKAAPEGGQKTLRIFTFTDVISRDLVRAFEEKTGIQVYLNYFQSNEDLYAKLIVSKGTGYDLIICSDYMTELLISAKLLAPINHDKLSAMKDMDPRLLGRYYDPQAKFSIPFGWTYYGIGLNDGYFGEHMPSEKGWSLVFEKPSYTVSMPDDVREAVFLAAMYLFGSAQNLTDDKLAAIKEVLIRQKAWVDSYGGDKSDYFLISGVVPVVVAQASFMRRVIRDGGAVHFVLPSEGSLMIIENMAIPCGAVNVQGAHAFIDYIISPSVSAELSAEFGYNPVNQRAYELLDNDSQARAVFSPSDDAVAKMDILSNDVPLSKLEDLWLAVKTA